MERISHMYILFVVNGYWMSLFRRMSEATRKATEKNTAKQVLTRNREAVLWRLLITLLPSPTTSGRTEKSESNNTM